MRGPPHPDATAFAATTVRWLWVVAIALVLVGPVAGMILWNSYGGEIAEAFLPTFWIGCLAPAAAYASGAILLSRDRRRTAKVLQWIACIHAIILIAIAAMGCIILVLASLGHTILWTTAALIPLAVILAGMVTRIIFLTDRLSEIERPATDQRRGFDPLNVHAAPRGAEPRATEAHDTESVE